MNKEYFSINNNFYGIINEENKLSIIATDNDPEKYLIKQNELEKLNKIKSQNIDNINKLISKRKRKILGTIIYSTLCVMFCEYSILLYLKFIVLVSILELLTKGSYKKINKEISILNQKNQAIDNNVDLINKELNSLKKEINYEEILPNNYNNNYSYSKNETKVKKLILKKK